MKIALINENSQAAKNELIAASLKRLLNPWDILYITTACTPLMMLHS